MLSVHGSFQKPKADSLYPQMNERHASLGLSSPEMCAAGSRFFKGLSLKQRRTSQLQKLIPLGVEKCSEVL